MGEDSLESGGRGSGAFDLGVRCVSTGHGGLHQEGKGMHEVRPREFWRWWSGTHDDRCGSEGRGLDSSDGSEGEHCVVYAVLLREERNRMWDMTKASHFVICRGRSRFPYVSARMQKTSGDENARRLVAR